MHSITSDETALRIWKTIKKQQESDNLISISISLTTKKTKQTNLSKPTADAKWSAFLLWT